MTRRASVQPASGLSRNERGRADAAFGDEARHLFDRVRAVGLAAHLHPPLRGGRES